MDTGKGVRKMFTRWNGSYEKEKGMEDIVQIQMASIQPHTKCEEGIGWKVNNLPLHVFESERNMKGQAK